MEADISTLRKTGRFYFALTWAEMRDVGSHSASWCLSLRERCACPAAWPRMIAAT